MGLNDTVSAERVHIGFFGMRNAGKSSLVNAVTGQSLSVVSNVKGTTTDPVKKAMELLPLGPVVIIDTPGLDDEGELGEMRVKKAKEVLSLTDIAVLVIDSAVGKGELDEELLADIKKRGIPYVVAYNKSDLKIMLAANPHLGVPEPDWSADSIGGSGFSPYGGKAYIKEVAVNTGVDGYAALTVHLTGIGELNLINETNVI